MQQGKNSLERQLPRQLWTQSSHGLWLPKPVSHQNHPWTEKQLLGKSLWEWISLLLVPLLIGVATVWVTNRQTDAQNALSEQQYRSSQQIAQQESWDGIMAEYQDKIGDLLLTYGLKESPPKSIIREVARSQTLDVLRRVDDTRKGDIIAYLIDLGLVQSSPWQTGKDGSILPSQRPPVISLSKADLSGADLSGANLFGVDLSGANLFGVDLFEADLSEADLGGTNLRGANLRGANLRKADLRGTDLRKANLRNVDLSGADLRGVDLSGADLSGADLPEIPPLRA